MSFLTQDTTQQQREQLVKDSIALSTLDALPPTDECMELINKYIRGEMEVDDIIANILSPYKTANA